MPEILQQQLPVAPWMADRTLRLPGTSPIPPDDWLQRDEAFADQMAFRDRLIAERPEQVHVMAAACLPAAEELLAVVLQHLDKADGYARVPGGMRRPDGAFVPLDGPPLIASGRMVQEDLLILGKPPGAAEHLLIGGVLCFPSNWTLAEKFGRTLARIHLPVASYDASIARRVQRLLDCLRPEAPLMRANLLTPENAHLYAPRRERATHHSTAGAARYVRVERQTLLRLPVTRAVVFSIHTYVVRLDALTSAQRARLAEVRPDLPVPGAAS